MSDALVKEDRLWTYRDYREWDLKEGERYELIYHRFPEGGMRTLAYGAGDAVLSDIFPGLEIPLEPVFAE
jgi:hypothetical protein